MTGLFLRNRGRAVSTGLTGLLLLALAGCSPSTFIAKQMISPPNRVPNFVKPTPRVTLQWPDELMDRFPTGTNWVGSPTAPIRWVLVPPADYSLEVASKIWEEKDVTHGEFRLSFRLPREGLPPAMPSRGDAFLIHGYGVDLETMVPWALYLAEAGWRCVLVDLRGHGGSGGDRVTFGVAETHDLHELRLALERDGLVAGPYVAVGHSLGAVIALRWQATDPAIKATVAFGPFSEFVPAAERLRSEYASWVPSGWVRRAARKAPRLLGVEPSALEPLEILQGAEVRAFLVAGAGDRVTPPEDSSRIRELLSPPGELLIVGPISHETLPYVFSQHGKAVRSWLEQFSEESGATVQGSNAGNLQGSSDSQTDR